ncbi:MAG: porin [bacterium]
MKKTLIAVAALAATTGAFAQVTVSGYFDRGYTVVNSNNNTRDSKLLSSSAGTTTVIIRGTEDLGGGLKAGFLIGTDWADVGGLTQDGAQGTTAAQTGTFANSQNYLELGGAFGTIRLGTPNNEVLTAATAVASPAFSTSIGSVYSTNFSIHQGYGTGTTGSAGLVTASGIANNHGNTGARGIRQANTIKYLSPNLSGFTAAVGVAQQNNNNGTNDTVGTTDMSVRYTNGPLDVMYARLQYKVGSNGVANGSLTAGSDVTHGILGARYTVMKGLNLHAGVGTTSSSLAAYDTRSSQFGASYDVAPNITIMGQYAKVNDKATTNIDRKMIGLGADYRLSAKTRLYARYDNIDYNTNDSGALGTEQKRTAFGVSHSF